MKTTNHLKFRPIPYAALAAISLFVISADRPIRADQPISVAPASSAEPPVAAVVPTTIDSAKTDLDFARDAIDHGDLALAMHHISRQLDRAPGDGDALSLLIQCVRTLASSDCSRGDHMEAMKLVKQASLRLSDANQDRCKQSVPIGSLGDITKEEDAIPAINASITASADDQARPKIAAAIRLADEAHHWWRPNNRNHVREALRQLRWVYERGSALSKDTLGEYFQAVDRLKGMVADSEWASLRVEAGYVERGEVPCMSASRVTAIGESF